MKYLLAGLTLAVVLFGAAVVNRDGLIGAAEGCGEAVAIPPELPVPQVVCGQAIEKGRGLAGAMQDADASLIDVSYTSFADAMWRLRPPGEEPDSGPEGLVAPTEGVWLVRMRGEFQPPSSPDPWKEGPEPGWMYAVLHGQSGDVLTYGYFTNEDNVPIR